MDVGISIQIGNNESSFFFFPVYQFSVSYILTVKRVTCFESNMIWNIENIRIIFLYFLFLFAVNVQSERLSVLKYYENAVINLLSHNLSGMNLYTIKR